VFFFASRKFPVITRSLWKLMCVDGRFFGVDPVDSYVQHRMPDETFGCAVVLFSRDFQTLNRDCIASFLCRVIGFFSQSPNS